MFPYCRVDAELFACNNDISAIASLRKFEPDQVPEVYQEVSLAAFKALLWVEVGFQGLENLAVSPASRNWTSGSGHHATDEAGAQWVLTRGAGVYKECLQEFVGLRDQLGITDDCFNEYRVEYLLDQFRAAG